MEADAILADAAMLFQASRLKIDIGSQGLVEN